jgi:hypothetical protein
MIDRLKRLIVIYEMLAMSSINNISVMTSLQKTKPIPFRLD